MRLEADQHIFENLVRLLDEIYPEKTTVEERMKKFREYKQVTNNVIEYTHWKMYFWTAAVPSIVTRPADEKSMDFFESWIENLHPLIKEKVEKILGE